MKRDGIKRCENQARKVKVAKVRLWCKWHTNCSNSCPGTPPLGLVQSLRLSILASRPKTISVGHSSISSRHMDIVLRGDVGSNNGSQ